MNDVYEKLSHVFKPDVDKAAVIALLQLEAAKEVLTKANVSINQERVLAVAQIIATNYASFD